MGTMTVPISPGRPGVFVGTTIGIAVLVALAVIVGVGTLSNTIIGSQAM